MQPQLKLAANGRTAPDEHVSTDWITPQIDVILRVGISILVLAPCFWHSRIQAGDLASHTYNAWLAGEIRSGALAGLSVVPQWSNVLFDWMLSAFLTLGPPIFAEQLAVGVTVLMFFWGAFAAIREATGRKPWVVTPCLAMLAYGLIFQLGFFNFYLSTALCLWTLALVWRPSRFRAILAAPLLILAAFAHALPVIWICGVIGYIFAARLLPPSRVFLLLLICLAGLVIVHFMLVASFPTRWSIDSLLTLQGAMGLMGVEQVWLFGSKYLMVAMALMALWFWMVLERMDQNIFSRDPQFHLWLLHLAAFIAIPSAIQLPFYDHVLAYIPQRISLFGAIILCLVLGGMHTGRGKTRAMSVVAALFFVFLYVDSRSINKVEDNVAELTAKVPKGSRVIASLHDPNSRTSPLLHIVDRACIGRCYSYGNYEPATKQFRIRAAEKNGVAADNFDTVRAIEEGRHVVSAHEAPLWEITTCPNSESELCLRELHAGDRTRRTELPVTMNLW